MKKEITFITSNTGKVATLRNKLDPEQFEVIQESIDLPEIQADTVKEIAIAKAEYAFELLQKPLIVQDSGFCIPALNNFPGPYVKYVWDKLGSDGFLKLMDGVEDRRAYFDKVVTYIDTTGVYSFRQEAEMGTLATEKHEIISDQAWGGLWELYIPEGYDKPLAAFTTEELADREKNNWGQHDKPLSERGAFTQFAVWAKENLG
jgi:XTP/dITP diphosphohydrolase